MFDSTFLIINVPDLPTHFSRQDQPHESGELWEDGERAGPRKKHTLGRRRKGHAWSKTEPCFQKHPDPDAFAQIYSQHRRESPGTETDQPQGISCKWIVASVAFSPNERRVHVGNKKTEENASCPTSRRSLHALLLAPMTATGNCDSGVQKPRMGQTNVVIVCNWHRSGSPPGLGVDIAAAASSADHHLPSRSASAASVPPYVASAAQRLRPAFRPGS